MEQIVITKSNGTRWPLLTKEAVSTVTATQKRSLMGEDIVDMKVQSASPLQFNMGDTISVFGSTYTLNQPAKPKKTSKHYFTYDLNWEGKRYDLLKAPYFAMSDDGVSISPDWSLTGNLNNFIDVLINNLNDHFGSGKWEKGVCPDTDTQTLTFAGENCLAALQYLCKEEVFNKEFEIEERTGVCVINLKASSGENLGLTFRQGRGKGLYELSCKTADDKNIITKLFAFGSDKNLPGDYRGYNQRLKLPGNEKSFIESESAIGLYGKIAGTKVFDDIFPHRTGTVTSIGASPDVYSFYDDTMDFDLNAEDGDGNTIYLLNQVSAKIHFNTGSLAGYEFEVISYDHATKKFIIKAFTDDRGQVFPDPMTTAFQMSEGDEYVIVDILMPQSYIDAAEAELQERAELYLVQNSQPRVQYSLKIAREYLKQLFTGETTEIFLCGDHINVQDEDLAVDKSIRIKSYDRNVLDEFDYELQLSDSRVVGDIQRLIANDTETQKILAINKLRDVARASRNWRNTQEVFDSVFDQEGYFDAGKIKPESIETLALKVGSRASNLLITSMVYTNYNRDKSVVYITAGELVHFQIDIENRTWIMSDALVSSLVDANVYYLYGKCSKTGSWPRAGIYIVSTNKIMLDEDPNYYHFLLGVINSVRDGWRDASITAGVSTLVGRQLSVGVINGYNLTINLDTGVIQGKVTIASGSSGYSNLTDKPDLSVLASQTYVDAIKNSLQGQIDGQVLSWFKEYDPTTANVPASDWTTDTLKQQHANDTFTNTLSGACWRWQLSAGVWSWGVIADVATQQALVIAGQAKDTADGKRRVFVVQPYTPYELGDLWSNGTDLKKCVVERLTGAYVANDWGPATNYDRTQTVIDNGLITTGRLEVGSGNYTDGNAWINGSENPADPDHDYRFGAGSSYANRANAKFWVKHNGDAAMKGVVEFGTNALDEGTLGLMAIAMQGYDLWENALQSDGGYIAINRRSHGGNNNYARSLYIYDGKDTGTPMAVFAGFDRSLIANLTRVSISQQHYIVAGTNDVTCGVVEADMPTMNLNITPKGTRIFLMFSASFNVTSSNQTLHLYMKVDNVTVRHAKNYIISGFQQISFQHIHVVTPGQQYNIRISWSGATQIQQRGSTDSERILTAIDLL
jgi:hypothetical protein